MATNPDRLSREELQESRENALQQRDSYVTKYETVIAKARGEQRTVRALVGTATAFALGRKMTQDPSFKVIGLDLDAAVAIGGLALLLAKENRYGKIDMADVALESAAMSALSIAAFRAASRK